MDNKFKQRNKRHKRIRAKIIGTAKRPRFSVFRSNRYIYGQLIDDHKGKTLVSASDLEFKKLKVQNSIRKIADKTATKGSKVNLAYNVGQMIAKNAIEKKIKKAVFDKGGYRYHGRVRAMAEGAREGGMLF